MSNQSSDSGVYPVLDIDITLMELENLSYPDRNKSALVSVVDIKSKIEEFSNWFNSVVRLSLFNLEKSDREEFLYLLLTLKRNIKYGLGEINHFNKNQTLQYVCSVCNETIYVNYDENIWDCLQSHEHFEQLYCDFLTGKLSIEAMNDNADSGIEQIEVEMENLVLSPVTDVQPNPSSSGKESPLNDFRFNFSLQQDDNVSLHYDKYIQEKLYPEGIEKAVRKIDRINEFTFQRSGRTRGVCLLCPCELMNVKQSKNSVTSHAIGQRHLRFASNTANVNALKKYHETWLNMEINYQAHQVFFRPEISSTTRCILCKNFVNYNGVRQHIEGSLHKSKVINLYEKRSNTFFFIELQVQVYGITPQEEVKNETVPVNVIRKEVQKNGKKSESDSSPSVESKEKKDKKRTHNIIKAVDNIHSENVLQLIPNRYREHLVFLKKKGNAIRCEACKINLAAEIDVIKGHICQSQHLQLTKTSPKKYKYYCEVCNLKFTDEASWEVHFTAGPNKHVNMAESRKIKVIEYECTVCKTVIYGDELSLSRHTSILFRNGRQKKEIKLPEPVKRLFKSKDYIVSEGEKLSIEATEVLKYTRVTSECCTEIETSLSEIYENCKAYPFGSRISGVGNYYSDLDVFIDTGDMYKGNRNQDPQSQVLFVRNSAKIFYKFKEDFQNVVPIPSARTPIVKLYHTYTDLDCDLSFRHGLSVENTKFLKFCLDLQPIAQPFILLLKKWSELCKLNEHITTYALAIMAIFFLQTSNYLLSVKRLRQLNPSESLVIDGWDTIRYTVPLDQLKTHITLYPYDLKQMLKDFFHYYSTFNYETNVVCPLLGEIFPRALFVERPNGELLPPEMYAYVKKLQSEEPEQFRALSPMCIQDPFDLSHNLTKACSNPTALKWKTLCDLSFKHLEDIK